MSSTSGNQIIKTFNQATAYQPIPSDMVDTSEMARTARISTLPTTYSAQQLMPASDTDSVEDEANNNPTTAINDTENTTSNTRSNIRNRNISGNIININNPTTVAVASSNPNTNNNVSGNRARRLRICTECYTVSVLCFVNLINYMDRFTIAGVLDDIQKDFKIADDDAGLLQTAFVVSYMICAPIFGYFGDRYSRRALMIIGILLWSTTTLLGSFMNHFGWFIAFRAMVGIGEASYSIIAPTIISDLFVNNERTKMLGLFYIFIPVGSGLGYIIGSATANIAGNWRWSLRVTPVLGLIAVILILFIREPERGESEGARHLSTTAFAEDIRYLLKNRSFMLSTIGFTCVAFVTGALAWWGPTFMFLGFKMQPHSEHVMQNDVSYKFGIIALITGFVGVPLGSWMSKQLRPIYALADPHICACGLLISAPMVYGALALARTNISLSLALVFAAELSLNLGWAIVADILLYVVVPTRRASAEAFQILISHALGDAISPYLVGTFSEIIKKHLRSSAHNASALATAYTFESLSLTMHTALNSTITISPLSAAEDTDLTKFQALQYALFSTSFVEVVGGVFFLITAIFVTQDREQAGAGSGSQQPNRARVNVDNIS